MRIISASICKYEPIGDYGVPKYEYALIEVWESKEANLQALSDRYIGLGDSELKRTGFYDKVGAMVTRIGIAVRALPLASTK